MQKVAELLEESPRLQCPESSAPGGEGRGGKERAFSPTPVPRKLALRLEKLFSVFCVCTSCTKTHKLACSQATPTALSLLPLDF